MSEISPADLLASIEERQDALLSQLRDLNDRLEAALARLSPPKTPDAAEPTAMPDVHSADAPRTRETVTG